MSSETFTGKDIFNCCFKTSTTDSNKHICNSCKTAVKCDIGKNGYSNLKTHLNINHGNDWKDWLKVFKSGGKGPMDKYFICTSDKAKNIYDWIEWIVDDNHSFSFCEKKSTRDKTKLKKISKNTLKKYMSLLVEEVKAIIKSQLPPSFGLIIDGWSVNSDHYSGIFAVFFDKKQQEVIEFMLSCNVAEDFDEDTEFDPDLPESLKKFGFTAADWFDVIVDVLQIFGIEVDVDNFKTIIEFISGDNCSTNRKLANDAGRIIFNSFFQRYH
jgi:hypothetical protein